jgi:hypothetical protein
VLIVLAVWPIVPLTGFVAVGFALDARAWGEAALVALMVAVVMPTPFKVDWGDLWADTQVTLHREALDDLAARARSGEYLGGADLPGTLALIDTDGKVAVQCDLPQPGPSLRPVPPDVAIRDGRRDRYRVVPS